jgi:hypothetical protein
MSGHRISGRAAGGTPPPPADSASMPARGPRRPSTEPHGILQRGGARPQAEETAAGSSARRAQLPRTGPSGGSAAVFAQQTDGDVEGISAICRLMTRMKVTESTVAIAADPAQRQQLYARAYQDAREAERVYGRLSMNGQTVTAQHMQDMTSRALTCVDQLVIGLLDEMNLGALREQKQQDFLPFDHPGVAEYRRGIGESLDKAKQWDERLDEYSKLGFEVFRHLDRLGGSTPQEIGQHREFTESVLNNVLDAKLSLATAKVGMTGLLLQSRDLPEALRQAIGTDVPQHFAGALEAFYALGDTSDPREREALGRTAWSALEKLGHTVDRFAEAAAANWVAEGADHAPWQNALAVADALTSLSSVIADRLDLLTRSARSTIADTALSPQGPTETPWAAVPESPKPSPKASGSASSSGRARRSRPRRSQAAPRAEAVVAAPDPRELALTKVDKILRSFPVKADVAVRLAGDPLAIGDEIGRDTTAIRTMAEGHDPLNIATSIRSSAYSWFGDIETLRTTRREVVELASKRPDSELQDRMSKLNDRIEALDLVIRTLHANEADSLKLHSFPKAKHVQRLLERGEIESVGAPVQLPTADDTGGRGKLFELAITPRPLADGRAAPPLFLHLHTKELATAEQCLTVDFKQLAAAHVKTARQKNLGPMWEQMQHSRGFADARVHRGPVDANLLNALRDRVPGASTTIGE